MLTSTGVLTTLPPTTYYYLLLTTCYLLLTTTTTTYYLLRLAKSLDKTALLLTTTASPPRIPSEVWRRLLWQVLVKLSDGGKLGNKLQAPAMKDMGSILLVAKQSGVAISSFKGAEGQYGSLKDSIEQKLKEPVSGVRLLVLRQP